MGMYDEIICDYPLPGKVPSFIEAGHRFQTKDLDCCLADYTIGSDGSFSDPNFTGDIEFYTSNWCGLEGEFIFTKDGEDFESVTFKANIVNGKVLKIEQTEYECEPALSSSDMRFSAPEDKWEKESYDMPLKGCRMFVQPGGGLEGYYVTIIEETDRQVCWKTDDGDLGVEPKYLGRTLFHTKEAADRFMQKASHDWDRKKAHYRELLESKRKK